MAKAKRSGSSKTQQFVSISMVGSEELQRRLNRLAFKDSKKVVREAIRQASKPILERAKFLVPKGGTGELERSLKVRALPRSRKRFGVQIIAGGSRKIRGTEEKVSSFYASFVELGTKYQKAQSFLRQAKEDGAAQFDRDTAKLIGKGIIAVSSKGGGRGELRSRGLGPPPKPRRLR